MNTTITGPDLEGFLRFPENVQVYFGNQYRFYIYLQRFGSKYSNRTVNFVSFLV